MNESKMNKSVIRRDSIQTRISSNVSSLVKQEEKVYVRSYTMTKKKRLAWIENNFQGEDETHLKDLFDKTKFQYDKDRFGPNGPNLFNV